MALVGEDLVQVENHISGTPQGVFIYDIMKSNLFAGRSSTLLPCTLPIYCAYISCSNTALRLCWPDLVPEDILQVNESASFTLSQCSDGFEIGLVQLNNLRVGSYPFCVAALRQHGITPLQSPCDTDLCNATTTPLCYAFQDAVFHDLFACAGDLILRTKWRVSDGKYAVRFAKVDQLHVWQEWVYLNLVDGWWNSGVTKEVSKVGDGEVGYADTLCLSGSIQRFHSAP
jgi:hypothetical protein